MTSIDLQPPPAWIREFPLAKTPFKEIQRRVESGSLLPVKVSDYRKSLLLDAEVFNSDKLTKEVTSLVETYSKIMQRSLSFTTGIFPSIVGLGKALRQHATEVEAYYGAFYSAIGDLDIKRVISHMDSLAGKAAEVKARLQDFLAETRHDKEALEAFQIGSYRQIWVPGHVAPQESPAKDGRARDEASAMDIMELHIRHVIDDLNEICNNIPLATEEITTMQGYYDTIRKDFITATENISMDEPFPPDVLSSEPPKEKVLSLWQDLICIIDWYIQGAYVTSSESQVL